MPRRAHCPGCSPSPDEPVIVELPHDCPNQTYRPQNYGEGHGPVYTGPRDDDGRPIGAAVRTGPDNSGQRIAPKIGGKTATPAAGGKTNHDE